MDGKETQEKMFNTIIIREMYIETTMKYYYTAIRKANILETDNTKCQQGGRTTRTHIYCLPYYMKSYS